MKTLILLLTAVCFLPGAAPAQTPAPHFVTAKPSFAFLRPALKANTKVHFSPLDFLQYVSNYPVTITAVGAASQGTVTLLADGTIDYTPGAGFSAKDSFNYTITDTGNVSSTSVFTVTDFVFAQGSYALYAETGAEPSIVSTGGILTVTSSGSLTFRCGQTSCSGVFDEAGFFYKYLVSGSPLPEVYFYLTLQDGMPAFQGVYVYGSTHEPSSVLITGYKIFPAGLNKGRYSVLFQPTSTDGPQGTGWATMTVAAAGRITYAGQLNDGQTFSATSAVKGDGTFPVTLATPVIISVAAPGHPGVTYQNRVLFYTLQGSATFLDIAGVSDFDGTTQYFNSGYNGTPPPTKTFPNGFNVTLKVIGSRFRPTGPAGYLLTYSKPNGTAQLTFTGGGLSSQVTGTAKITPGERVLAVTAPVQSLTIYAYDSPTYGAVGGLINGSFQNVGVGAKRSFAGVVFQKQNMAAGLFRGTTDTGTVTLTPE